MSVIESIKAAIRADPPEEEPTAQYRCEFCDSDFETSYSFCPDCGSERVVEVA